MRYLPILVLLLASPPAFAAGEPIIDMHFHAWPRAADGPPDDPGNLEVMETALAQLREYNVVLAATSGPTAFIDRWAQEEPDRLMLGPIFPCIDGLNPNWHQYRCFDSGEDFPDLAWPLEYRTLAPDDVWISTDRERPTVTISVHQDVELDETPLFRLPPERRVYIL